MNIKLGVVKAVIRCVCIYVCMIYIYTHSESRSVMTASLRHHEYTVHGIL